MTDKKKYTFSTDKIEVRSASTEEGNDYYVTGFCNVQGLDYYNTEFTDNFRESLKKQITSKDVKMGTQHQNAFADKITENVTKLIEQYKAEGRDYSNLLDILNMAKAREFPLAKVVEADLLPEGLFIKTKLNKHLKKMNPEYFDFVWGQLQDGFLDGMSIEFFDSIGHDEHKDGKRIHIFDDAKINGIDFVSNAAHHGNRIQEVFVRSAVERGEMMEEEKQTQENKEEVVNKAEDEVQQQKQEVETKKEEVVKAESDNKSDDELEKLKAELKDKEEALKTKEDEALKLKASLGELATETKEAREQLESARKDTELSQAKAKVKKEDKYGNLQGQSKEENNDTGKKKPEELEKMSLAELAKEAEQNAGARIL